MSRFDEHHVMNALPNKLPLVAAAAPAPQPVRQPAAPVRAATSFADLLRRNQPARPAESVAARDADAPREPEDAAYKPVAPGTAKPRPRAAERAAAGHATPKPTAPREATPAETATTGHDAESAERARAADTAGVDPSLMQWLQHLHRPAELGLSARTVAAGESAAEEAGGDADASADAGVGAGAGADLALHPGNSARGAAAMKAEAEIDSRGAASAANDAAGAKADPGISLFAATLAEQRGGEAVRPAATASALDLAMAAPAAGLQAAAMPPPVTGPAPDAVPVTLTTPVDTPEFARALGVQISVLAQAGVQHAELHLNPAELGPVSVQIAIDGHSARVDFGADLAATRQAIEAGLPELAGALRDAGFTLTGGGVSEHSRSPQGGNDGNAGPDSRSRDESRAMETGAGNQAVARSLHRVPNGGLDLYA